MVHEIIHVVTQDLAKAVVSISIRACVCRNRYIMSIVPQFIASTKYLVSDSELLVIPFLFET